MIVPPGVLRMGYGYENRRILELIVSIGNPFNNEITWGLTDNNILFTRINFRAVDGDGTIFNIKTFSQRMFFDRTMNNE